MDDYLLVELVQQNAHLFDKSRADYKDLDKRQNTWASIAKQMQNATPEACSKRFKCLRDRFNKLKKEKKSGVANDPTIPAILKKMIFLYDHVSHRPSSSNFPSSLNETNDVEFDHQAEDVDCDLSFASETPTTQEVPINIMPIASISKKRKRDVSQDGYTAILNELKNTEEQLRELPPPSKNAAFGSMVADYIDKFDSEEKRSKVRVHILNYLHNELYVNK